MKSILDYIKFYPEIATKSFCDEIVKYYRENADWKPSTFSTSTGTSSATDRRVRMNDFWITESHRYHKELKDVFFSGINLYTKEFARVIPEGCTPFRINSYPEGGFMIPHVDNIHHSHGQRWGYPHITALMFMNDNYDGGEFVMCDGQWTAPKKQGSVVIFPSNFMYPHGVEKVTKGNRYTIMTWII